MSIAANSFGVKGFGDFILRSSGDVALVLDYKHLVGEESIADYVKIAIYRTLMSAASDGSAY